MIAELVRANSVLRTAKKLVEDKITLKFLPLDLDNVVFVSVTDASFAGQPNGGPQLEYVTLMAERSILDGSARANLLGWGPVESKTRTYLGRVGSGRTAGRRGGVGQDWVPTELFV